MKVIELSKMSTEELVKKELELREEFSRLVFQHRIRPLENTSLPKKLRKDIARIQTLRTQVAV